MPVLHQNLFAIGAFQGLLLAVLLLASKQNSNANRVLGLWCLCLALNFLGVFIPLDGPPNGFSVLIGWHFLLPALYGSFLYLYCRNAINERPFKPSDLLHFSPWLICVVLNYEILFASGAQKLQIIAASLSQPMGWHRQFTDGIVYGQAFIYVALSAWLIWRYQRQARTTLSNFNPQIFAWLWSILLLDLAIWLLKAVGDGGQIKALLVMGDVLIVVFIYSISLAQWRDPSLFKIAQLVEAEPQMQSQGQSQSQINSSNKSDGALDSDIRSSLLRAVQEHMRVHEAFRDNQLTLTRLAEAVGVSTHHLSEVLNQQEGKNFYQFVNEYRINDICQKMKADSNEKVLDLAMAAGFASKSTFNAVFKQLTGTTPTQYRKGLV